MIKHVRSLQLRIAKATREGRKNKVKALQWLLTHSWAPKLLAVKRVTENKGKRTAGVDGVLWSTPKAKLKAGFLDKKVLHPTIKGTPQGGIISPTLSNMTLDGLEKRIDQKFNISIRSDGCRSNNIHKIHLIRYADDFVVTATNKQVLVEVVKPLIENFLAERGLELPQEKTKITHINEGFDFLGQNIRMFPNGKLIITPSNDSMKSVADKINLTIKKHRGNKTTELILNLNPIITGWSNYHRHVCSKKFFYKLDFIIWRNTWNWARRRHNNLGYEKIVSMYFRFFDIFCG